MQVRTHMFLALIALALPSMVSAQRADTTVVATNGTNITPASVEINNLSNESVTVYISEESGGNRLRVADLSMNQSQTAKINSDRIRLYADRDVVFIVKTRTGDRQYVSYPMSLRVGRNYLITVSPDIIGSLAAAR